MPVASALRQQLMRATFRDARSAQQVRYDDTSEKKH
jgi:hypothetical protein